MTQIKFMEPTVDQTISFDIYWQILKRRWVSGISIFSLFLLLCFLLVAFRKPNYVAEGKIIFTGTNTISSLTGFGTDINKLASGSPLNANPLNTEVEIISSSPILETVIKKLNLRNNENKVLKPHELLKKLTIANVERTEIISVKYQGTNPQEAAKVVNTLIEIYLQHNVSANRSEAVAARKFIETQLPRAEAIVNQTEAKLATFKEKYKIVALQQEVIKSVDNIADLQKQINQNQSQLADVNAQYQEIRRQLDMDSQEALITTSLSQVPGVQDIMKEIQQLETQLATRRTVFQDEHPQIIDLENKLNYLRELLKKRIIQVTGNNQQDKIPNVQLSLLQQQLSTRLVELESTRLGLKSQVANSLRLQADYKQRLNSLPRLEKQQRQLERQVQAAQATYTLLLQKLQESRIAENQNLGNANVLSHAQVPEEPISSSYLLFSASLLALLLTLLSIFFLEAKDKNIKNIDEARALFGLTLLGVIPAVKKTHRYADKNKVVESYDQMIVIRDFPRSPISEAYRMLRANLRFMSADKELKVIVVTSSVPQEGKSTVAANLATAIAQKEHKVLLIDADLHRPVQHKIWDINNNQGLSNVIVDQAATTIAIKPVMKHLDVLTSGVVPPNPAALLDSRRMATLIDTFASQYNFVIIDTPALNVAADAATLGQMADGVLLVVRPGVVDAVNATLAKEFLEKSGQNVLGQVVNGVIPQNERYSYYFAEEDYPEESVRQLQTKR